MNLFAIKMLIGDRAKYLGILMGLTFAAFIITQQTAIFVGIMTRTYGFITDTSQPNIWVMDQKVQFVDDIKPLKDTDLYRVKSISDVEWAVPLYKGLLRARLSNGTFQTCNVIGIDDATLIGGPPIMIEGKVTHLRWPDAIIVNQVGAGDKLSGPPVAPDGPRIPLAVGDVLELNDNRAEVVGICDVTRTFQSQPVLYMTYNRAVTVAPQERKLLSFILAKSKPGISPKKACEKIQAITGLAAYTRDEFKNLTMKYYLKYTGIPINFGVAVGLGFIIGCAIAGQTFYNFTLDNLKYLGTLKAMGASNLVLIRMILLQALTVGSIGWGIGVGGAALFGYVFRNTELAFKLPWELLLLSGVAMLFICMLAAFLSLYKVVKLDPAIVFK